MLFVSGRHSDHRLLWRHFNLSILTSKALRMFICLCDGSLFMLPKKWTVEYLFTVAATEFSAMMSTTYTLDAFCFRVISKEITDIYSTPLCTQTALIWQSYPLSELTKLKFITVKMLVTLNYNYRMQSVWHTQQWVSRLLQSQQKTRTHQEMR